MSFVSTYADHDELGRQFFSDLEDAAELFNSWFEDDNDAPGLDLGDGVLIPSFGFGPGQI